MIFEDCICFQLGRIARKITKHYKDKIAPFGLTHGQFFMLVALMEEDGILAGQLAAKVALDRATTTGLLDRLQREGWIERRPDKKDRRALRIHMTERALSQRDKFFHIFEEINGHFLNRFSSEEWKAFQVLLAKLEY